MLPAQYDLPSDGDTNERHLKHGGVRLADIPSPPLHRDLKIFETVTFGPHTSIRCGKIGQDKSVHFKFQKDRPIILKVCETANQPDLNIR
jgi:hypothetical protein